LAEERAKNAQDEKKKKSEKEPEEGAEFSGIHPSRLNQMR
jgi:nucleolar protein 6